MSAAAEHFLALVQLQAEYAAAVDAGDWQRWIELFTEDGVYRLVPRENHERGFPLATMSFKGRGMLADRAYAIRETLFHDPYYQRHVLSPPRIVSAEGGVLRAETNYAVFRTKLNGPSTVFNVGRYLDAVVATDAGYRLAERVAVYDSEMIPNSVIYPV